MSPYRSRRKRHESDISPVSGQISAIIRELGKQCRTVHPEIWARWYHIVGEAMYGRTALKSYRNRILTIGVANSAWLQELNLMKQNIIDRIEDEIGSGVVTEIRLIIDSGVTPPKPTPTPASRPPETPPDPSLLPPDLLQAADRISDPLLGESIKRAAARYSPKKT